MAKFIAEKGKVVAIEIGNKVFYTKNPIPFEEMSKYSSAIDTLEEILDFNRKDVPQELIEQFLEGMLEKTLEYVKLLLSEDRWFYSSEIQEKLRITSQSISGIRSSLTKRANKLNIKNVDEAKFDADRGENKYRIKPEYRELLRKALGLV